MGDEDESWTPVCKHQLLKNNYIGISNDIFAYDIEVKDSKNSNCKVHGFLASNDGKCYNGQNMSKWGWFGSKNTNYNVCKKNSSFVFAPY